MSPVHNLVSSRTAVIPVSFHIHAMSHVSDINNVNDVNDVS